MAEVSRVANAARDGTVVDPFRNQWPRDLGANGRNPVLLPPATTTFLAPHKQPHTRQEKWSRMASNDLRDYVLGQELTVRILTTGEQTSGRHDVVDAFQLPDTATPLHLHTRYEERLFVLEGECTLWVGPDMVQLRAGGYYATDQTVLPRWRHPSPFPVIVYGRAFYPPGPPYEHELRRRPVRRQTRRCQAGPSGNANTIACLRFVATYAGRAWEEPVGVVGKTAQLHPAALTHRPL
jgi:mannose-6-phosphate isomerase-like protein (cupin superfamily)